MQYLTMNIILHSKKVKNDHYEKLEVQSALHYRSGPLSKYYKLSNQLGEFI